MAKTNEEVEANEEEKTTDIELETRDKDKNPLATNKEGKPTILKIYDAIHDVIGGTNPDELFCLTMPGMVINADNYTYDTRFDKPFKIAANESRLVNKLFDPVKVVGSDNGRLLATQFKTALDSLTPKINRTLINAKNELRKILSMPTSYTLDDGTPIQLSFQQLFYKLYEEYVDEKQKWAILQNDKRNELLELYSGSADEDRLKREEEYLIWYQTIAEANLLKVNMKHGKVLGLFSDNDMKIIEGILDSGIGAELQEARERVSNIRKYDPDGGYVYPVSLEPSDWFKSLSSEFSFIDLLQSSEQYGIQYESALKKRNAIAKQIQLFESIDRSSELGKLVGSLDSAKEKFDSVTDNLDKAYGQGFSVASTTIVNLVKHIKNKPSSESTAEEKQAIETDMKASATTRGVTNTDGPDFTFDTIIESMNALDGAQRAVDGAAIEVADCANQLILAKSTNYTMELKSLYINLTEANEELAKLHEKLNAAITKEDGNLNNQLFPDALAGRFMQVNVSSSSSEMSQSSSEESSSTQSSVGVNFLFGGYHSTSSHSNSKAKASMDSADFSLDIGFLATKVSITRNWFNPGIFALSEDMYNTTSNRISLGNINDKKAAQCIFPCYPTAFVIGKDVSIKISTSEAHMTSVKESVEDHASKGGGFLCFKSNPASSSSSSKSDMSSSTNGNSIIIKIPGPQVLGYYLQATPQDKSKPYATDIAPENMDVMVTEFVAMYQKILEEKNIGE